MPDAPATEVTSVPDYEWLYALAERPSGQLTDYDRTRLGEIGDLLKSTPALPLVPTDAQVAHAMNVVGPTRVKITGSDGMNSSVPLEQAVNVETFAALVRTIVKATQAGPESTDFWNDPETRESNLMKRIASTQHVGNPGAGEIPLFNPEA